MHHLPINPMATYKMLSIRTFLLQDFLSYSRLIATDILFFFIITCIITRTPVFGSTMAILGIERYVSSLVSPLPLVMAVLLNTIFSYKDTSLCFLYIFIMYLNLLLLFNGTSYLMRLVVDHKQKSVISNEEIIILLKFMIIFGYDLVVDVWSHSLWFSLLCFLLFRPIYTEIKLDQSNIERWTRTIESKWMIWMPCLFGLIGSDYHGRGLKYWIATSVFMALCVAVFAFQYGLPSKEGKLQHTMFNIMFGAVAVCIFVIVLAGWTS